ncbi:alpha/beta fold hydrolase [Sphingobium aromaticivastans]|uniref:alpha/beta hydrolase n=1 Tax=Sphingobium aromaticivastans TaxID=1778665 RepID=UPI003016A961
MSMKTRLLGFAAATAFFAAHPVPVRAMIRDDRPTQQMVLQLKAQDGVSVPTLLTFPKSGMNIDAPVIIHCHGGPGASPLDGSGPWIAQGMAANGYTVIAPSMRHGQALFDSDFKTFDKDVKAVVDYVQSLGFRRIILTGSSFGSITITRYMIDTQDDRISALIHFAPTEDVGPWTARGMGDAEYWARTKEAGEWVSRGDTNRVFAPAFVAPPPMKAGTRAGFMANPRLWIDMWGPASNGNNLDLFPNLKLPMLLLVGEEDGFSTRERLDRLKAAATASPKVDILYYPGKVDHSFNANPPVQPKVVADTTAWLQSIGMGVPAPVRTDVITITDTEPGARAVRYMPAQGDQSGVAFLTINDFDGEAMRGPNPMLGQAAAAGGAVAIGMQTNRGSTGMLLGTNEKPLKDIGDWVDYLERHGFSKVVLVGHGLGATRAAHYMRSKGDKRIVGLVAAAPVPDGPALLKAAAGPAAYASALKTATAKKDSMDFRDHVYFDHLPDYLPHDVGQDTLGMSPASFLANWGPDAPAFDRLTKGLGVPLLILAGKEDKALPLDAARQLARTPRTTLKIYDAGHDLGSSQATIGDDLRAWARAQGFLEPARAGQPVTSRPQSVPAETPSVSPHGAGQAGTPETAG